ncbi:unnamed protein product [Albugo candida]|uniref:Uncharacterized protein n=1 Tax=Albugo candida TaxID=65357 RepID=A0A024G834_9STRA|nr:unnamed protein product [Albugo candida]|eukprot:CCI42834.1 unnamed protein product [Albugo candida]
MPHGMNAIVAVFDRYTSFCVSFAAIRSLQTTQKMKYIHRFHLMRPFRLRQLRPFPFVNIANQHAVMLRDLAHQVKMSSEKEHDNNNDDTGEKRDTVDDEACRRAPLDYQRHERQHQETEHHLASRPHMQNSQRPPPPMNSGTGSVSRAGAAVTPSPRAASTSTTTRASIMRPTPIMTTQPRLSEMERLKRENTQLSRALVGRTNQLQVVKDEVCKLKADAEERNKRLEVSRTRNAICQKKLDDALKIHAEDGMQLEQMKDGHEQLQLELLKPKSMLQDSKAYMGTQQKQLDEMKQTRVTETFVSTGVQTAETDKVSNSAIRSNQLQHEEDELKMKSIMQEDMELKTEAVKCTTGIEADGNNECEQGATAHGYQMHPENGLITPLRMQVNMLKVKLKDSEYEKEMLQMHLDKLPTGNWKSEEKRDFVPGRNQAAWIINCNQIATFHEHQVHLPNDPITSFWMQARCLEMKLKNCDMDEILVETIGQYEQYLVQHDKCFLMLSRAKRRHSAHNLSIISYPTSFNAIKYSASGSSGYEIGDRDDSELVSLEKTQINGAQSIPLHDPILWFSALPTHELRQTRQEFISVLREIAQSATLAQVVCTAQAQTSELDKSHPEGFTD